MACSPEILRRVPLFGLLDDEETAVLAGQVELKTFAPRQRIYKIGDPGGRAYVMVSGRVRVATIDEDNQEVLVDFYHLLRCCDRRLRHHEPCVGKIFLGSLSFYSPEPVPLHAGSHSGAGHHDEPEPARYQRPPA